MESRFITNDYCCMACHDGQSSRLGSIKPTLRESRRARSSHVEMDHDLTIQAAQKKKHDAALLSKQVAAEKDVVDASNKDKMEKESVRGARCQKTPGLKESFENVPGWPIVTCNQCNTHEDKLRRMESTGPHLDKSSSTFNYRYRC